MSNFSHLLGHFILVMSNEAEAVAAILSLYEQAWRNLQDTQQGQCYKLLYWNYLHATCNLILQVIPAQCTVDIYLVQNCGYGTLQVSEDNSVPYIFLNAEDL